METLNLTRPDRRQERGVATPVTDCPLFGAGHHWLLEPYERCISRGVCSCGAVRFFASEIDPGKDIWKRIELLNKKYGKEGHKLNVKTAANTPTEHDVAPDSIRPMVPPKPTQRKNRAAYWEQNKEAILRDYYLMRLPDFLLRWQIATTTWIKLKEVWGVKGKGRGRGKPRSQAPEQPKPESPSATKVNESHLEELKVPASIQVTIMQMPASTGLPKLPDFDGSWPELVQLRWLDVYRELVGKH